MSLTQVWLPPLGPQVPPRVRWVASLGVSLPGSLKGSVWPKEGIYLDIFNSF